MKILMIGGTGTISYDATKYFLSRKHDVYHLNRGHRNDLKDDRLHNIIGDATDYDDLEKKMSGQTYDAIFDFIIFNKEQMIKRVRIYNNKCKQFFFISSATAYKFVNNIITEQTPLENKQWKYSSDKIECENYLTENSDKWSFNYTIIRPYVTYDNRRIPFPVITKKSYYTLLDRIQKGKPVIICGDGTNKLTLTQTKDFAVALEGLLLNAKAFNQAFHITGDCITTWNELLHYVEKSLGKKAKVIYIPTKQLADYFTSEKDELLYDKSCDHIFSNEKICRAVPAFKTTLSVEQGIEITVDNLMNNTSLQTIDQLWNDIIDVIIEKYEKTTGKVTHRASLWSHLMYYIYEKTNWSFLKRVFSKIRRMRGRL